MIPQTREAAKIAAVTQMHAESRALPVVYARQDVVDILKAAAEWEAVQDAPTVQDIADVLAGHSVKPSGVCTCGAQVNTGRERGFERTVTLNRHRAVVLHAAGYRWAPETEWEWAAVGPREAAADVSTYSWGTEDAARALHARMVALASTASRRSGPVVLVRRRPAGDVEEVERWAP